ncbi:hypothetical protein BJY52DRAFT_79042 [Lactarius psammicola]|nr:hypothetical protein BJY52DRAFT_79042 [Lactarius psammicola]
MAAALRKVSLDYHQTLGRVQATSGVPVAPFRVPETPSGRNTPSSHATPSTSAEVTVPAEVHSNYYLPFLSRRSGLYTAIVHDGPLRTRIQCFWSELDELLWHFRHARDLLFTWLATMYHLMLFAVRYTFISSTHPFVETYKRSANSVTSMVLFIRRIRRAMSLRYVVMVWLLPVLDKIRKSALEAVGNGTEEFSKDIDIGGSPVRSDPKGNGVAPGMPILVDHTPVGNGGKMIDILFSERVPPTLLDHPAPTTIDFSTRTGTYSPPADYHGPPPAIFP